MPEVLTSEERSKIDDTDDRQFYDSPRFVTHADDAFLERLTEVYAEHLSPGDRVFDAMSSWVSHLPDYEFECVVGHGLNGGELATNQRLDEWFRQDLNDDASLPLADRQFDAVLCALSVQYLEYPGDVFAEFERVLDPGGIVIVSFTNRMFPTKAVRAWRTASMQERVELIRRYADAGGLEVVGRIRDRPGTDPFRAVVCRSPPEHDREA